jgi:hypothetical protein
MGKGGLRSKQWAPLPCTSKGKNKGLCLQSQQLELGRRNLSANYDATWLFQENKKQKTKTTTTKSSNIPLK